MYSYVGPKQFLELVDDDLIGRIIRSEADVLDFITATNQQPDADDLVIATYIIDIEHRLRVNDRHSEHVVCAGGQPVLSAGEIGFELVGKNTIEIAQISNQSTGYCPDPSSWPDVERALSSTGIPFPDYFTTEIIFRVCPACGNLNVVKDNYYVCMMCDAELE